MTVGTATIAATDMHVAKRLTFGPTPSVLADIGRTGTRAWIDAQLAPAAIDDRQMVPILAGLPVVAMTAAQVSSIPDGASWATYQMAAMKLLRAAYSNRQVFELVCDFWSDHFSVDAGSYPVRGHFPTFYRDAVQPNALGPFSTLLRSVAQSGAMLTSLSLHKSRGDGGRVPNENFARELLELHTVGVHGGYTETDIKHIAWVLTGWGVTDYESGTFRFSAAWHSMGPVTPTTSILGWTRGALTGQAAGESLLAFLARHPATARRLAHKLAVRFIGEHVTATDAVVTAAADAYLASNTGITPMLRVLLTSPEFAGSVDRRVRRPFDYVAACLRVSGAVYRPSTVAIDNLRFAKVVRGLLMQMGQPVFEWPTPDGFPDTNATWMAVGPLMARWNAAVDIAFSTLSERFVVDPRALVGTPLPVTNAALVDRIATRALGAAPDLATRAALLAAVHQPSSAAIDPDATTLWLRLLGYALQSPAAQTR